LPHDAPASLSATSVPSEVFAGNGSVQSPSLDSRGATLPTTLFLSARSVRARYDDISDMTVYRWLRDPRVAFPAPVHIGRRRYWKVADLIAWEQARANAVEVS
jgi:predicted DNA-binding transcriptional regulator AlpA